MRNRPSQTAEGVCLFRAMEYTRERALRVVEDAYAQHFLGTAMRATLSAFTSGGNRSQAARLANGKLASYVVTRHRYIDDALIKALGRGVEQVVVLGAGYDSRAYRLADTLGGRPVFELDFPATAAAKRRILTRKARQFPDTNVQHVAIDFLTQRIDDRLAEAGFAVGAPSFFVWEGVSMYLTRGAVKETLAAVRRVAAPGSQIAMDWWFLLDSPGAARERIGPHLLQLLGEPVTLSMHPEDVGDFLRREKFRLLDLADATELERRYLRDARQVYAANYCVVAASR